MNTKQIYDWRDTLREFLISGGTDGRSQSEIIAKLNGYAAADAIRNELEALHLEDKVQRFDVPAQSGMGRSKLVWRATNKILES